MGTGVNRVILLGHHGRAGMTRAAAVRACAGAALRGALAWAVPAGLAGMAWASHYSVWEWAVWRAEGLRLPLPPPFPVWLVGNLTWPWHILEYSPWWPELGFGPARWPAHLWHDYAARAWQAPAAGAVPGALLGLRRGLARVRTESGPSGPAQDSALRGAEPCAGENINGPNGMGQTAPEAAQHPAPGSAEACAGPACPQDEAASHPVVLLRTALAALPDDGLTLEEIARHPVLGDDPCGADDPAYAILRTALRETGWTMQRTKRRSVPVEIWWKPAAARHGAARDRTPSGP